MGAEVVATCDGAGGQWRMAVRPPASTHRPHGTVLSPSRASSPLGVQWRRRRPRTTGVSRRLGVRARAGYGGADVAARVRRRVRGRRLHRFISFDLLSIRFSPKIQTGVLQTLITKVVKQVALFKSAKGSTGFYSLV
jgi:hypothetical protein